MSIAGIVQHNPIPKIPVKLINTERITATEKTMKLADESAAESALSLGALLVYWLAVGSLCCC